ncbi:aminoacyl-tRNA hydrolase [Candidatus Similichlamydia laticola]|uniref:Peptidyl-tRNA hydrolase n=1 Tax=Candidatus Similichlamydia laticola TaxID=2170265 RepID=A0A369KIC4_9BACT|nr:aminoacyl-tRNA hydrolase [Candidatus Similichlamydia laticola]RDB31543.1 Peptidyl-tRNA hydrolase [Candidatus Similichlamydia laticola]
MLQSVDTSEGFVVGLGNPGLDETVHNVGFVFINELTKLYGGKSFPASSSFSSPLVCGDASFRVLKPRIEMNSSGKVVFKALRKRMTFDRGEEASCLLVVAEDVELTPGKVRVRFGKSSRGHNGVKSVVEALGSNAFFVLWIGIGRPLGDHDLSEYVLSRIPEEKKEKVETGICSGLLLFQKWLCSGRKV